MSLYCPAAAFSADQLSSLSLNSCIIKWKTRTSFFRSLLNTSVNNSKLFTLYMAIFQGIYSFSSHIFQCTSNPDATCQQGNHYARSQQPYWVWQKVHPDLHVLLGAASSGYHGRNRASTQWLSSTHFPTLLVFVTQYNREVRTCTVLFLSCIFNSFWSFNAVCFFCGTAVHTCMLQQLLEIKSVPMMPRNSREIESHEFLQDKSCFNRGIARPYLSNWRHLPVTLGNQISQSGTRTTKQVLSPGNTTWFAYQTVALVLADYWLNVILAKPVLSVLLLSRSAEKNTYHSLQITQDPCVRKCFKCCWAGDRSLIMAHGIR